MIEKVEVRKLLASYENKFKEEIKRVRSEIEKMNNDCCTIEMERIWKKSAKHSALHSRLSTLTEALWIIQDIRCDEILNDC